MTRALERVGTQNLEREENERMEFGTIGSCWDTKIVSPAMPYVGLSSIDVYRWATKPANMSREYLNGRTVSASRFKEGPQLIEDVMRDIDAMFIHEFSDYNNEYLKPCGFRDYFRARLEDPGILYHVVFFNVANDAESICFEWHAFKKHTEICRNFFAGKSYDLAGNEVEPNMHSAWRRAISVEGAIVGERKLLTDPKPDDIDVILNFDVENESLRHLRMLKWPAVNQGREACANVHDAFERAERMVRDMCLSGRETGEIYSIDHAEIINTGIWGVTNVRVFIKRDKIRDRPIRPAIH